MKPYDRPTDTPADLPAYGDHERLAAAALAGLSSCTNYSTAPATEPSAAATGGSSGATGPLTVQETDIPGRAAARSFPTPDGDHPAEEG